jgi:hypothetical protein
LVERQIDHPAPARGAARQAAEVHAGLAHGGGDPGAEAAPRAKPKRNLGRRISWLLGLNKTQVRKNRAWPHSPGI